MLILLIVLKIYVAKVRNLLVSMVVLFFLINPFFPRHPFSVPLKTSVNLTVFCFQVVEKGCTENKWVKLHNLFHNHLIQAQSSVFHYSQFL